MLARSGGRGRLPTCVVRIRLSLRFIRTSSVQDGFLYIAIGHSRVGEQQPLPQRLVDDYLTFSIAISALFSSDSNFIYSTS